MGDRGFSLIGLNWRSIVQVDSLAQTRLRRHMLDLTTFANNSQTLKKKQPKT
ncbi:hypothetical protein Hanom_Chr02g00150771 [Helianthus anomalus]